MTNTFPERCWRNLLMDIEARQVVPVLGSELLTVYPDPSQATLYQHIARELVVRLGLSDQSLSQDYSLLDVTRLYLQDPRNRSDELHYETRDILSSKPWPIPLPLTQLAAITHLDLFISTTFDSLLEQALNAVRKQGADSIRVLAYSEKRQVEDLPPGYSSGGRRTVFQLFGKLDEIGDYGLTEEKILEFSHRLQTRDLRPANLFDVLREKKLLILGCSFPGWLGRFLLRATKGDQLFTQGARGVIADRTSNLDPDFVMFLQRRQMDVYNDGDAVQFIGELHRRWLERFGANPAPPPALESESAPESGFKPYSVFISYASEDRQQALLIKQAFDEASVDAWLDTTHLQSGDAYRRMIEDAIENCSCFVPLISRHTATQEKRVFRWEWNKAIEEAKEFPPEYPFIEPVLLDDTKLTATGIPREFNERHYRKLEALPQLIDDAKKRMRELRLQKRSG